MPQVKKSKKGVGSAVRAKRDRAGKTTGRTARRVSGGKTAKPAKKPSVKEKKSRELFAVPRGMHDILPVDAPLWSKVRGAAGQIAEFYGFTEIETPILEKVDLFVRSVGETTDIVEKEMFVLRTKGGDKLALRPDITAPVVRSYIQNGMHKLPQPQKLYYIGPVFRHERPQAGRYRQFNQFGLEVVGGDSDPAYDAQVILTCYRFIEELKIKPLIIHINSIGCRICRPGYRTKLLNFYKGQTVCRDCSRRMKTNPLRLLDCKKEVCQQARTGAPSILDSLCSPCRSHLKHVLEFLEEVELPYMLNPMLVRGLDYYNRTVFEIFHDDGDLAIASGGRYDYLAEMIGGRSTAASGAAIGIERVVELIKEAGKLNVPGQKSKVFLVHIGELAKRKSFPIVEEFRKSGISVSTSLSKNSLSNQLEAADKQDVSLALILGQKEVYEESIIIRDMETGVQESVPVTKVVDEVKKKLRS